MLARLSVYLFAWLIVTGVTAAEKRLITEKDLFDFVWVGDAQVSPDGARVAFVRVTVNEKTVVEIGRASCRERVWTVV